MINFQTIITITFTTMLTIWREEKKNGFDKQASIKRTTKESRNQHCLILIPQCQQKVGANFWKSHFLECLWICEAEKIYIFCGFVDSILIYWINDDLDNCYNHECPLGSSKVFKSGIKASHIIGTMSPSKCHIILIAMLWKIFQNSMSFLGPHLFI